MDTMTLTVTTDADGDGLAADSVSPRRVYAIGWDGTDLGSSATMSLVASIPLAGEQTIFELADADASGLFYPRALEHDDDGSDAATTTMPIVGGVVTLAVASGGDTKTAICTLYLV